MSSFDFLDDFDIQEDDPDYVPESSCHVCGAKFGPANTGHCSPITGGCCQNFASQNAFDKHLRHSKDWRRTWCLTTAEMEAAGWQKTGPHNSWRTPPPKSNPWKKEATA